MAIKLLKSQTINGQTFNAFDLVSGLDIDKEAALVQGGGAVDLGGVQVAPALWVWAGSSWELRDPSGASPVSGRLKKRRAAQRGQGLSQAATGTSVITRCLKVEAEGPFSRFRVRIYSEGGAATTFRLAGAVSETAALTSANTVSQPMVGGTAYPAVQASAGAPGWVRGTVAGADPFNFPSGGANDLPQEVVSDWFDIPSIDRVDGGSLPLAMIRVEHDGAANGAWSSINVSTWRAEGAGKPWFRDLQAATISTADGVTDLTKTINFLATTTLWCAFEFDYDAPAYTVMAVGDSQTEQQGGLATGGFGTWAYQAVASTSRPSRPVSLINAGRAGGGIALYSANAIAEIARQQPDVVLYQAISSNDGVPTAAGAAVAISTLARVHAACAAVGARLIAVVGIPFPAGVIDFAANEAYRLQVSARVRAMAAAGLLDVIDFESAIGSGTNPNRIMAPYLGADNIHVSAAASPVMAAVAAPVIGRNLL